MWSNTRAKRSFNDFLGWKIFNTILFKNIVLGFLKSKSCEIKINLLSNGACLDVQEKLTYSRGFSIPEPRFVISMWFGARFNVQITSSIDVVSTFCRHYVTEGNAVKCMSYENMRPTTACESKKSFFVVCDLDYVFTFKRHDRDVVYVLSFSYLPIITRFFCFVNDSPGSSI